MATTGTLVGTYPKVDGSPRRGTVHIIPSALPIRDAVGRAVISEGVHVALDDTGSFSVNLVATDDTTLNPAGVTYTVSLRGQTPVTGVNILTGITTHMEDVTPVAPAPPTYAAINGVISVAGHTGVVTVADLTADLGLAKFIPHQNTPPADPNVTPAYVDTSTSPPTVKGWNGAAWVAIGGGTGTGGVTVQDEGVALSTAATVLNFTGSGVTATGTTGTKTIDISAGGSTLTVQDEGSPLASAATTLNFTGAAVTATGTGGTKTISVSESPFEPLYINTTASGAINLPAPATATWAEYTLTGDVVFTPPSGFGAAGAGKATALTVVVRQPATGGVYNRQVNWASNVTFLGGTQVAAKSGAGVETVYTLATSDDGATYNAAGSEVEVGANRVVTLADAATITIDASLGDIFRLTFTAAVGTTRAFAVPTNMVDGQMIEIQLQQDGAGGKTATFPGWGFGDDLPAPLNLSAGSNKMDLALAQYVGPLGKPLLIDLRRGY